MKRIVHLGFLLTWIGGMGTEVPGQEGSLAESSGERRKTFAELKERGARLSSYRERDASSVEADHRLGPDLEGFRRTIEPLLSRSCFACHGPDEAKGSLRIDTLDPDLFEGDDVDWWLDVLAVLTNGEMPPAHANTLDDRDRARLIEWLAEESQRASSAGRRAREHSSFRRLTRYEYDYALRDLLSLPFELADDLPPEPVSEDGFRNSSEILHLSASQLRTYQEVSRRALRLATVWGDRPTTLHWGVSMEAAAAREWAAQEAQLAKIRETHPDDPVAMEAALEAQLERFRSRPGGTYFEDRSSGRKARQSWGYEGARYAWKPLETPPQAPGASDQVAILQPGSGLIVELGDRIPERGTLRVRFRGARVSSDGGRAPRVRLVFGWQASNDSRAYLTVGEEDVVVDALPDEPSWYQWDVPLSRIYPRNSVRGVTKLGDLPSPSEYVKLVHASREGSAVQVDYVEVAAPLYETWPPVSHRRVFLERLEGESEGTYARRVLANFMGRAWRREPTAEELDAKLRLLERVRPSCESFEEALLEVFAAVLSSPHFLYLVESSDPRSEEEGDAGSALSDDELATRLAIFLWCGLPDDELRTLAGQKVLRRHEVLVAQVERMLQDPRSRRFSHHFVHQWLGLELLEFLQVDRKVHPRFDAALKQAMLEEPVAFFHEVLRENLSVLDFLHADFAMVNERLAEHYGLEGIEGDVFRRVELGSPDVAMDRSSRGGLLAQAGLLAMNSDGVDSHPIKRGVWLLERLLDDPPPPPPAAVPQIDLADPEIAKLTLKERIEQHRDHAACLSCHSKIDPWGIAFENFDAVGGWRSEVRGQPVDSRSVLFNGQELDGLDGLKRFLLENRQDQFVRAVVHKLATFALGRPMGFADRAALDRITAEVRRRGDGLATLVTVLVTSDLFLSR